MSSEQDIEWALVFPTSVDFNNAINALQARAIAFRKNLKPDSYPFCLFLSAERKSEAHYILLKAKINLSGSYELRPTSTPQKPLTLTGVAAPDDLVQNAAITYIAECFADPTKLRLVAHFVGNAGPVLPYLNAIMRNATYTPGGPYLTFSKEQRMITIYPNKVAIAKADDIDDAWNTVKWVKELINETWRRRHIITPSDQRQVRTTALEIFGWLPQTNCRKCGELTCLAFAVKLLLGEQSLSSCTSLQKPENVKKKAVLAEMLGLE